MSVNHDHEMAVKWYQTGELPKAKMFCAKVLSKRPKHALALQLMGLIAHRQGDYAKAIEWALKAVSAKPDFAEAYNSLGAAYLANDNVDGALNSFRMGAETQPENVRLLANYGAVLKECGRVSESIEVHQRVLKANPGWHEARSSLLLISHYLPEHDPLALLADHRKWSFLHASAHLPKSDAPSNLKEEGPRRLRVGFVSPDLRDHPVARFITPYFENHDRQNFELFVYSDVGQPDAWTERIRNAVLSWRDIVNMPDAAVAELICQDGIDILIDLAGHTLGNRLLVFARKPAPIQVTYLGYPATTGLEAIGFRLTDHLADPVGMTEDHNVEKLIRLSQSAWCYEPDRLSPITDSPALRNSYVTFGSFNNIAKIHDRVLRVWGKILELVPDSRLLLKAGGFRSLDAQKRFKSAILSQVGIAPERIMIRGPEKAHGSHLELYQEMDIALDPFPYHGTTTTCEALWMGVPVVTLAGRSHVSRVGVSLLTNVGLPEMVAESEDEYLRIAVELGRDVERLVNYRLNLRDKMLGSQLLDAPFFAREIEGAFRQMWISSVLGAS